MTKINISAVADRLQGLFGQLDRHTEDVAVEYARAMQSAGRRLEDELVKRGYDRSWLQCLEEVGDGSCDVGMLRLDPMKRTILRLVAPARQRQIIEQGISGKPLNRIPPDELRLVINNGAKRRAKKSVKRIPVSTHIRAKVDKTATPADRLRIAGHSLRWRDVVTAIAKACEAGEVPHDQQERLLRAVAVLSDTGYPVEVS